MFVGFKNKFIVFITLFGVYNVIKPILLGGKYNPSNVVLLGVSALIVLFLPSSKKKNDVPLLAILGIILFSLLVVLIDGKPVLTYYTKWVLFAISLLFYYVMLDQEVEVSEKNYRLLYFSVLLQVIFFTFESFDASAYTKMRSGSYLVLCFDNKNSTAMHLLTLCCILVLYLEKLKQSPVKKKRSVAFIAFALCLYFMYLTGSRSSLVGALFILPFYFMPNLKKRLSKPMVFMFLVLPFLFAAIYVALYNSGHGDLQLFGRSLFNGRQDLWIRAFDSDFKGWILGVYSKFARADGIPFQLHNGVVDLIATYGLLISFAFLAMIYKLLTSLLDSDSSINRMIVVCICALILQSIGEAALFNGTRAVYVCMILSFIERNHSDGVKQLN